MSTKNLARTVIEGGRTSWSRAYREFADKLSPPRRWLAAQIGRPWSLVRGELLSRFDPRTTAGRHIIFCHVLPWVEDDGCPGWKPFRVDRHGLLRIARPRPRFVSPFAREPLPKTERVLETWLAGRRVSARGPLLFWFTPTAAGGYRQHHRLAAEDAALWRSLPEWFCERQVLAVPRPAPHVKS